MIATAVFIIALIAAVASLSFVLYKTIGMLESDNERIDQLEKQAAADYKEIKIEYGELSKRVSAMERKIENLSQNVALNYSIASECRKEIAKEVLASRMEPEEKETNNA